MSTLVTLDAVPLRVDADGVLRLGQSRVTLDTVIEAFLDGASAESIAEQYPSAELADVYYAISVYLRRRAAVDAYRRERQQTRADVRRDTETKFSPSGIRERLLARQKAG